MLPALNGPTGAPPVPPRAAIPAIVPVEAPVPTGDRRRGDRAQGRISLLTYDRKALKPVQTGWLVVAIG